jgi:hypothetical protein
MARVINRIGKKDKNAYESESNGAELRIGLNLLTTKRALRRPNNKKYAQPRTNDLAKRKFICHERGLHFDEGHIIHSYVSR